ncbi:hypothetical protein MRX96_032024 [Rhipicephalus microplus]
MGYEAKMLQEHHLLLSMQQKTQRAAEQEEHKECSWRLTYIMGVPTLLLPLPLYMNSKAGWCIYCMVWMTMYWTTETIPLPATALLPLVMFPLLGIFSTGETTALYFNDIGFIILSSLTLAVAVECTNLHKCVSLESVLIFGMSKRRRPLVRYIRASVPTVMVSVLLFGIPRDPYMNDTIPNPTWDEVNDRVSRGTVLVICGGLTLAEAFKVRKRPS